MVDTEASTARIVQRFRKVAVGGGDYPPDPHSSKAFLSEFTRAMERGQEVAESFIFEGRAREVEAQIEDVRTVVDATVHDLLEMARRMSAITTQNQMLGVNERRLSAKMSGIMSSLFYHTGRQKGLAHALKFTAYSPTLPSAPEAPRARV
jgi:hypothetical protein